MNRMDAFDKIGRASGSPVALEQSSGEIDLTSLWQAYIISRDESLRNRLIVHYLPVARMIARHMHNRMPGTIEVEDLVQSASLGLRSAIGTFDLERGIPFEHYCGPRIRGAVLDYLRSLDWAPRMLRSRVHRVKEMVQQLEMESGEKPTDEQVSSALAMPMDELQMLRGEMAAPVHVRTTQNNEDGDRAVNLDMLPSRDEQEPFHEAQRSDLRDFVVKGLSAIERQVLILYYYESLSLREIGATLKLCESRVSQIHQTVIKRLRERMHRIGGTSLED